MTKIYRHKETGALYELESVLPGGNLVLQLAATQLSEPPPGGFVESPILAPSELDLVPEPKP